jgi:hypothetical protein
MISRCTIESEELAGVVWVIELRGLKMRCTVRLPTVRCRRITSEGVNRSGRAWARWISGPSSLAPPSEGALSGCGIAGRIAFFSRRESNPNGVITFHS